MRSFFFLFFICLLSPLMGQQTNERPSWTDGFREEYRNSYLKSFSAEGSTALYARKNALQEVADERSRATGRRFTIQEVGGEIRISSQDELTVSAQVIDEYSEMKPNGMWRTFLLVQIKKNPELAYESVRVTDTYSASPRVLVPGMAQLYKGSTIKALSFIGAEVIAVGGVVAFEGLRTSYKAKINTTHNARERQKYIDMTNSMQNLRNGFIAGAAAVYLWNVVDGLTAKGRKHVEVGRLAMEIGPYMVSEDAGVLFTINF